MQPINLTLQGTATDNCTNFTCCFPFPKKKKKDKIEKVAESHFTQKELDRNDEGIKHVRSLTASQISSESSF